MFICIYNHIKKKLILYFYYFCPQKLMTIKTALLTISDRASSGEVKI